MLAADKMAEAETATLGNKSQVMPRQSHLDRPDHRPAGLVTQELEPVTKAASCFSGLLHSQVTTILLACPLTAERPTSFHPHHTLNPQGTAGTRQVVHLQGTLLPVPKAFRINSASFLLITHTHKKGDC